MADTIKTTTTGVFELQFVDGDTRKLNIKNPKSTIETSEITALNTYLQANNLLIGDQSGATFGKIKTFTKISKNTRELDLT